MTEDQIKHMVDRFLMWKLPRDTFNPDCGISFDKGPVNAHTQWPSQYEPSGTNLFDATQADAMVRHMVEGLFAVAPGRIIPGNPWQTVPLPATAEMIAAGEALDKAMRDQGFANAEPDAIYLAMLDAAPSPPTGHDLFKTGDADAPDSIKDRNGEVALDCCRACGRGESELREPCTLVKRSTASSDTPDYRAAVEDAVDTLESMDLHIDNPLYDRLRNVLEATPAQSDAMTDDPLAQDRAHELADEIMSQDLMWMTSGFFLSDDDSIMISDALRATRHSPATVEVTDEMVERAWAGIVGSDVAPICMQASVIRGDIKNALVAALTIPRHDRGSEEHLLNALARIAHSNAQNGEDAMKMRNIATAVLHPEKASIYDPPAASSVSGNDGGTS